MADSSYGNAMTEIALALAMAFFSIMVLTMVSMGATPTKSAKSASPATMKVAKNTPADNAQATPHAKKQLVIFWDGQFLDRNLTPVNPDSYAPKANIILAMPPELPMQDALSARARFSGRNTVVSALDARWLKRLGAMKSSGPQSKGN